MLVLTANLSRRSFVGWPIGRRKPKICQSAHTSSAVKRNDGYRWLRSLTMVILQDAAESLSTVDGSIVSASFIARIDDRVGQPLMVAFLVIMRDEFSNSVSQGTLIEEDHFIETLRF